MKEQDKVELKAPKPGESIRVVSIEEICVPNGTYITEGTILIHFGSDKATITMEAEKSGKVFYAPGIVEGAEIATESIVGYILVGDNEGVENNPSNQPDMYNPTHRPTSRFTYEPRWWQTDSDIIRLVQPYYDTIVGENPSEKVKNAAIVGIFCHQEQGEDKRHECDHFALLQELQKDPTLVVGLFSFTLVTKSANFAKVHQRCHAAESLEVYLQSSPHLAEILKYPNVVPFSFLFTGDLENNLAFRQSFFDHFDYKHRTLTKR
ncbi:MAG: hypothetical protein K9M36_02630 [Candidatus Pacebacteria bacterium]|nr:hypothetical protein [Candidatus Paceibacterota bacterium]